MKKKIPLLSPMMMMNNKLKGSSNIKWKSTGPLTSSTVLALMRTITRNNIKKVIPRVMRLMMMLIEIITMKLIVLKIGEIITTISHRMRKAHLSKGITLMMRRIII